MNTNRNLRMAIVVSHPIQHFAPWYRELAKRQHLQLRVFYCCDWGAETYRDPDFQVEFKWDVPLLEGYDFEFLPIPRKPERMGFWQIDNPTVSAALDRFNPDIVQIYGYASRTIWRVARWTRSRGKPLMIYSDSNSKAPIPVWKRALKNSLVRYFYSYVAGALFVGDNNYSYHARYGLPEERLFPGMIPVDRYALLRSVPDRQAARNAIRAEFGIPSEAFVVLFCGKLIPRKRPLDLVIAAHEASKTCPHIWAILVGEGPERKAIEVECRRESIGNVTLTGFINQSSIAKFYAAADCLAVTSDADPHPLVVTEAAAFGLPAIVSDRIGCIGPNDTARPGGNAFPYPCGDIKSLTSLLATLYTDHSLYQNATAASLRISEDQDVSVAADRLIAAAAKLTALGVRQA